MAENQKQKYWLFGLIGIAGLAVLWLLFRESSSALPATSTAAPDGSGIASYPNSQPINLGDVNIVDGSSPQSAYNLIPPLPDVEVTGKHEQDCSCSDKDDCDAAGAPVSVQKISEPVLIDAVENLKSFQSKLIVA